MSQQQFPEPIVAALIFNEEDKLFLIKSHKWYGSYGLPGGHVELGETMEDALKREIKEETSMDITNISFLLFQEFVFDDAFWKKKHFIFFEFACKTISDNVVLNDEAEEYVWVTIDEALNLPMDAYTRKVIQTYHS